MSSLNQVMIERIKKVLSEGLYPNPNLLKTFSGEELKELRAWTAEKEKNLRNAEFTRKSSFHKPEIIMGLRPPPSTRSLTPSITNLRRFLRMLDIEINQVSQNADGDEGELSKRIKQWMAERAKDIQRYSPIRVEKGKILQRLARLRPKLTEAEAEMRNREEAEKDPKRKEERIGPSGLMALRAWAQALRNAVSALETGQLVDEPIYAQVTGEQAIIEDLKNTSLIKSNHFYGKLTELMSDTGNTYFRIAKRGRPDLAFTILYRNVEQDFKIVDAEIFRGENLKPLSELAMSFLTGYLKESEVKISPVEIPPLIERIELQMKEIKKTLPILSVPKMEIKWKLLKQNIHEQLLGLSEDPSESTIHDSILEILRKNDIQVVQKVSLSAQAMEGYIAYMRGFFKERWGVGSFDIIDTNMQNNSAHLVIHVYGVEMPSLFSEFYERFERGLILQPYGGDRTYLMLPKSSTPASPSYELVFILNTTDYPLEQWSAIDASTWSSYIEEWKRMGGKFKWKEKRKPLSLETEIRGERMDFPRVKSQVDAFLPKIIEQNKADLFEIASSRDKDAGSWVTYYLRLNKKHYGYEVYFNSLGQFFCRRFKTSETIFFEESVGDLEVTFNDLFKFLNQPKENLYGLDIDEAGAKIKTYLEDAIGSGHFEIDDQFSRDKANLFVESEGACSNIEITFIDINMKEILELLYNQFDGIDIEIPYDDYFGDNPEEETPDITQMRERYQETGEITFTLMINSVKNGEYAGWTPFLEDLWNKLNKTIWISQGEQARKRIDEIIAYLGSKGVQFNAEIPISQDDVQDLGSGCYDIRYSILTPDPELLLKMKFPEIKIEKHFSESTGHQLKVCIPTEQPAKEKTNDIKDRILKIIKDAGRLSEIQLPERQYLLSLSPEYRRFACEQFIPLGIHFAVEQVYAQVYDNDVVRFLNDDLLPVIEGDNGVKRKEYALAPNAPEWLRSLEKEIDYIVIGRTSIQSEVSPFDHTTFYQITPEDLLAWIKDLTEIFKATAKQYKNKQTSSQEIQDRLVLYCAIYGELFVCLIEYPSSIFSTASKDEQFIDSLIELIKGLFVERKYHKIAEELNQERLLREIADDETDKKQKLKLFTYEWEDWVFIGDSKNKHKHRRFLRLLKKEELQKMINEIERAKKSTDISKDLSDRINATYIMLKQIMKEKEA